MLLVLMKIVTRHYGCLLEVLLTAEEGNMWRALRAGMTGPRTDGESNSGNELGAWWTEGKGT